MDLTQGGNLVLLGASSSASAPTVRKRESFNDNMKRARKIKKNLSDLSFGSSFLQADSLEEDESTSFSPTSTPAATATATSAAAALSKKESKKKRNRINTNDASGDDDRSSNASLDESDVEDDGDDNGGATDDAGNAQEHATARSKRVSYANSSFTSILSYVLGYCRNCLEPGQLAVLALVCELPQRGMEVLLRLASRKGPLFQENALLERYAEAIGNVQSGIDTLVGVGLVVEFSCAQIVLVAEEEDNEDEAVERPDETKPSDWLRSHADVLPSNLTNGVDTKNTSNSGEKLSRALVDALLRSVTVEDLKSLFYYMTSAVDGTRFLPAPAPQQQQQQQASNDDPSNANKEKKQKVSSSHQQQQQQQQPKRRNSRVFVLPRTLPPNATKRWLLFVMLHCLGFGWSKNKEGGNVEDEEEEEDKGNARAAIRSYRGAFVQAWDTLNGKLVCLNKHVVNVMQTVFLLFSAIVPGAPLVTAATAAAIAGTSSAAASPTAPVGAPDAAQASSGGGRGAAIQVAPLPSTSATLSALHVLSFPPTPLSRFVLPVALSPEDSSTGKQNGTKEEEGEVKQEADSAAITALPSFHEHQREACSDDLLTNNILRLSQRPQEENDSDQTGKEDEPAGKQEPKDVVSRTPCFTTTTVPFILFRNSTEWELYRAAMKLENDLFDLIDNRRFMRLVASSSASSSSSPKHKKRARKDVSKQQQERQQQEKKEGQDEATALLTQLLSAVSNGIQRSRAELNTDSPFDPNANKKNKKMNGSAPQPPFLYDVLYRRGSEQSGENIISDEQVQHLLSLTPLHKWLLCASRLIDLLEYCKHYVEAIKWLDVLLSSSVCPDDTRAIRRKLPMHQRAVGPSTTMTTNTSAEASAAEGALFSSVTQKAHPHFAFYVSRRGHWTSRKVIDLAHLNRGDEALSVAEQALEENNVSPRHPLCFMRRAHRLAIETTLVRLHKPPRRWTGPPKWLLSNSLLDARHITVHASRRFKTDDPVLAAQHGWVDTKSFRRHRSWEGLMGDDSVESCALAWYVGGRGRREKGWHGAHCEGGWIAAIFTLLFLDVMFPELAVEASAPTTTGPPFTFTSCYQGVPLDYAFPCFYRSRRASFDARLNFVHPVASREELLDFATRRVHAYKPYSSVVGLKTSLPILRILAVVPLLPLRKLLEKLICGYEEGVLLRFSGFPDLLVWRETESEKEAKMREGEDAQAKEPIGNEDSVQLLECLGTTLSDATAANSPVFILSEVKSPNDRLSEKQVAMIDTLVRCGFTTEVCHVQEKFEETIANEKDRILSFSGRRKGVNSKAKQGSGSNPHQVV